MDSIERELTDLKERVEKLPSEADEVPALRQRISELEQQLPRHLSAWERVQLARHQDRPYTLDYVERIFQNFQEIHGDRKFGDDKAMIGGMALLDDESVMVIGQQKGRNTKERLYRNYGMPRPEGYRKALRLMKMAEKFKRPVLCFIDTPGAYPGMGAEERGQSEAIAANLRGMAELQIPILVTILGEGGSGGALAIGLGDRVLMLENSIYSVISPESCSAILWKDQEHAREAAECLKLTCDHLLRWQVIDEIVPEPAGGAHLDWDEAAARLRRVLKQHLSELRQKAPGELLAARYARFRRLGEFLE